MVLDDIVIKPLQVTDYQTLRKTTDWNIHTDANVEKGLQNDLFSICVFHEDKPVGMGRVIGDGAMYFYLQDIIIHPKYQGKGIGRLVMEKIEAFLEKNAPHHAFIGLMAAVDVEAFYYKFGYQKRADDAPGMFKRISKNE